MTADDTRDAEPRDETDADASLEAERELTMAELKARAEQGEREPGTVRARARDDELLDELPETDHHLGRFAGWRAVRKTRWIVSISLTAAVTIGVVIFVTSTRDLREHKRHPLPEVEATISEGTAREMTLSSGRMRVGLSREPPGVNVLHLPDRDITLGRGADKAQLNVEIEDGRTVRLKLLSGKIQETLTAPDARPLLD